jgi:hypothetical protein
MKTLYLAKEPDAGVRNDLARLSGEVTVVDCKNAYSRWYKRKGYNCISKDEFFENDNMRFDVVIGNPPYSDTSSIKGPTGGGTSSALDSLFYLKSMEISDRVSLIIRSKFFAKQSSTFRRKLFSEGGLVSILYLPESTFPSISLTETCVVTWQSGYKGPTKITYKDGTVKDIFVDKDTCIKLTNPDYVSEVPNNIAYRHVRGEYDLNELKPGNCPMITTMGGKKSLKPLMTYVDKSQHTCCVNQYGVVMNDKFGGSTFGGVHVKEYEHSISGSSICLKTDSYEESVKLKDYLLSDTVQEIVALNKISNVHSKELFKTIPDLV